MEAEQLRELQELANTLKRLEAEPGYVWLKGVGNEQIQNRLTDIILTPPESVDDMVKKIYAIGECAGIKLMTHMVSIQKEQLEYDIKNLTKEDE